MDKIEPSREPDDERRIYVNTIRGKLSCQPKAGTFEIYFDGGKIGRIVAYGGALQGETGKIDKTIYASRIYRGRFSIEEEGKTLHSVLNKVAISLTMLINNGIWTEDYLRLA